MLVFYSIMKPQIAGQYMTNLHCELANHWENAALWLVESRKKSSKYSGAFAG